MAISKEYAQLLMSAPKIAHSLAAWESEFTDAEIVAIHDPKAEGKDRQVEFTGNHRGLLSNVAYAIPDGTAEAKVMKSLFTRRKIAGKYIFSAKM